MGESEEAMQQRPVTEAQERKKKEQEARRNREKARNTKDPRPDQEDPRSVQRLGLGPQPLVSSIKTDSL